MSVIHITQQNFESAVLQAQGPVMIDFWAPWCGYCRRIAPLIDALAQKQAGKLTVCQINVDEEPQLAEQFQVMTIPALFIIQQGKTAAKPLIAPSSAAQIEGWLKENGAL